MDTESDQPTPEVMRLRMRAEVLLDMLNETRGAVSHLSGVVAEKDAQIAALLEQVATAAEGANRRGATPGIA